MTENTELDKVIRLFQNYKDKCIGFLPPSFIGLGLSIQHKSFLQYEF